MSTPTLRERLADILSQVYDDRPVVELEPTEAAPHHRAAGAVLAVLPLHGTAATARLNDALSRTAEAMNMLTAHEGDDALELKLGLASTLDGPPLPFDLCETKPPRPLTADRIRTRLEERLVANWPRMNHAGYAHDIVDSLMNDVLLIVTELQDQASGWRGQVDRTLEARDQARALAATLEEITAEATRLLRHGEYCRALAVLQSDGQLLDPCGVPLFADDISCARPAGHGGAHSDDPDYTEPPHASPRLPDQLYVVVAERGTGQARYRVLDLNGVFSDVEDANSRARDLVLELTPGDPTQMTNTADGSVTLACRPWGDFAGLVEVAALDLDPHLVDARDDAEREAAGEYDSDHGRDLDDEE
ncbi:hypothetical protein [Streptomyces sp. NBC_00658]|uniref:hypothetical protein n=1 Tax=Streptomyces sp. NBC_00658 TaxID=2975800 RepID=UPI003247ED0A